MEATITDGSNIITNQGYDLGENFKSLFNLFNGRKLSTDKLAVLDYLVDEETLTKNLTVSYPDADYVIFPYAHPYSALAINPEFPEIPPTHYSLLLCKVVEDQISDVIHLDSYEFPFFVDVLGGTMGGAPNPNIHKQIILKANDMDTQQIRPLQEANWEDMNALLYSLTTLKALTEIFRESPEIIHSVFSGTQIDEQAKDKLVARLLDKLHPYYLEKNGNQFQKAPDKASKYHTDLRSALSKTIAAQDNNETVIDKTEEEDQALLEISATLEKVQSALNKFKLNLEKMNQEYTPENGTEPKSITAVNILIKKLSTQLDKMIEEKDITVKVVESYIEFSNTEISNYISDIEKDDTITNSFVDFLKEFVNYFISLFNNICGSSFFSPYTIEPLTDLKHLCKGLSNELKEESQQSLVTKGN